MASRSLSWPSSAERKDHELRGVSCAGRKDPVERKIEPRGLDIADLIDGAEEEEDSEDKAAVLNNDMDDHAHLRNNFPVLLKLLSLRMAIFAF